MRTLLSLALCVFAMGLSRAQVRFEAGYFVDDSGTRTSCFIKDHDRANNPRVFEYKLTQLGPKQQRTIDDTQEFGVDGFSRYVRAAVMIDRSSSALAELSQDKSLLSILDTLFIRELVVGEASLYQYFGTNLERYFLHRQSSSRSFEQLIFK